MALEKDYTANIFGKEIIFENVYIRISFQNGNKTCINLTVNIYDKTKQHIIETKYYNFIPSVDDGAVDFIKQGYEYLKTLDEYRDCIDVLEEGQRL